MMFISTNCVVNHQRMVLNMKIQISYFCVKVTF